MGNPLSRLEEQLSTLVPRGLSDGGRAELEAQIDALAAEVVSEEPAPRRRRVWPVGLGIAAAATVMVGLALLPEGASPDGAAAKPDGGADSGAQEASPGQADGEFVTVDYERMIGDGEDHGIVLDRFNEPMRSWSYDVREMELVLDPESGLRVRIVQDRREQVRVAVTSF